MQRVESANQSVGKNKTYFIQFFLPILIIGWMGSSVKYLNYVFSENTRWLFLGLIVVFVLTKPKLISFLGGKLALILSFYIFWCFSTSFWSTIPLLSILKSGIYALTVPVLILIGIEWTRRNKIESTLNYLSLFAWVTLVSCYLGERSADARLYYTGLTTVSNMFGFMVAASAPYFFWKAYQTFREKVFFIHLSLSLNAIYFVFVSMARAAILMVVITLAGLVLTLNLSKKMAFVVLSMLAIIGFLSFYPSIILNFVASAKGYVFKGQQTIFNSRAKVWDISYKGAVEGGLTGLGFGIAYNNYNFNLENRLSSVNYGREKGSSQLAIIEEIGLIGFLIYLILMMYLLIKLINLRINARNQDQRVLTGILSGIFLGMIVASFFEAWWLSPGAPESIYFWVLIGAIRGFELSLKHERLKNVQLKMEA